MLSELGRWSGNLQNKSVTTLNGEKAFKCQCRCGRWRTVLARSFNARNVLCCEQCVEEGKVPKSQWESLPRVAVSLDHEVLALLGYDLSREENRSGTVVRRLLREYSLLVRDCPLKGVLTKAQWNRLLTALTENPDPNPEQSPRTTLLALFGDSKGAEGVVKGLSVLESHAVLAALRWAVAQGEELDRSGEWWLPGKRTEE